MPTAVAIFVKTPGLSPIKTRLGARIGAAEAVRFHQLAAACVAGVVQAAGPGLTAHWAVAEEAALDHPAWQGLATLWQGDGGLGQRLDTVYAALLARYGRVLMIGADAPQVSAGLLAQASAALDEAATPFAMGPAMDGGFWLFGGRQAVAGEVWRAVPYSQQDTRARLAALLQPQGGLAWLPTLRDVDTADDLAPLLDALSRLEAPCPEQAALREWLLARGAFPERQNV